MSILSMSWLLPVLLLSGGTILLLAGPQRFWRRAAGYAALLLAVAAAFRATSPGSRPAVAQGIAAVRFNQSSEDQVPAPVAELLQVVDRLQRTPAPVGRTGLAAAEVRPVAQVSRDAGASFDRLIDALR
jgi:hypothetical protein